MPQKPSKVAQSRRDEASRPSRIPKYTKSVKELVAAINESGRAHSPRKFPRDVNRAVTYHENDPRIIRNMAKFSPIEDPPSEEGSQPLPSRESNLLQHHLRDQGSKKRKGIRSKMLQTLPPLSNIRDTVDRETIDAARIYPAPPHSISVTLCTQT